MDGNSIAYLGELLTYAGDSERGLDAGRPRQAAQSQSSRMVLVTPTSTTRTARRDYRGALDFALKINMPGHWGVHVATAAALRTARRA